MIQQHVLNKLNDTRNMTHATCYMKLAGHAIVLLMLPILLFIKHYHHCVINVTNIIIIIII